MATRIDITATNLSNEDRQFLEQHRGELSRSTLTAKWINTPGEKADRNGQTLATRNPEVIKAWAEKRGGHPATVPGTEHDGPPGVLRFEATQNASDRLQEISWDDWLGTFEQRHLVFLFQQTKTDGDQSNFFRLDSPDREDA
jgi:hypothetical protein